MTKGLLLSLAVLCLFGFYQFRIYRVAAMEEGTKQAKIELQTRQEQAKIEAAKAIEAAASAPIQVQVPTPGMKMSDYESGCLAALTRAGTINATNRNRRLAGTGE